MFDLPLPAVVSAQKGLNEPRYPTLKGIARSKKKEIKDVKAADLGITPEPPALRREARGAPPSPGVFPGAADAVRRLVRSLREDAKAIKRTGDPNPGRRVRCIVEDDRQGNPKVMASAGRGHLGSRQMKQPAEAVWLTDKATPRA